MSRVEVEKKVLNENQILAEQLRERYRQRGILCVNLISAPGSGKTLLLEKTLERMDKSARVAVLTGDLQTENDAKRLAKYGFPVKQIVTGGTCHLDARMVEQHLADWKLEDLDLLIVENVGNLVCPVELRSGRRREDRPAEHDRRRRQAAEVSVHLLQVGIDGPHQNRPVALRAIQGGDWPRKMRRRVHPQMEILEVSSTTGEGLDAWMDWLETRQRKAKDKAKLVSA